MSSGRFAGIYFSMPKLLLNFPGFPTTVVALGVQEAAAEPHSLVYLTCRQCPALVQ